MLGVVSIGFLLLLRVFPRAAQEHVVSVFARWEKALMGMLDRGVYLWAVFMVVTIGVMLIGAIAMLFVPR